jgi:hypothetical protein
LVAGATVALGLAGALVVSLVWGGGNTATVPTSTTSTSAPLDYPTTDVTVVGTTSNPPTVPADPADDFREAGAAALAAWGRFAVSGDLSVLSDHFHPDSPQSSLLTEKVGDLAADPLGEPPYSFVMENPTISQPLPGTVIMQGLVSASRGDEGTALVDWRLKLVWSDESRSWLVWTLEEVG